MDSCQKKSNETLYRLYIMCDVWYYFFALCKMKRKKNVFNETKYEKDRLAEHCHLKEILFIVWWLWLWPCRWRDLVGFSLVSVKQLIVMHVIFKLQYTVFNSAWTRPPGQTVNHPMTLSPLKVTMRKKRKRKESVPGIYFSLLAVLVLSQSYVCWSILSCSLFYEAVWCRTGTELYYC